MRIKVNPDRCTGCRLCMQVCAMEHFKEINPSKGALRIEALFPDPGKYRPYVCIQCGKCAEVCPEDAIGPNEIGAYLVNGEKCTNCGTCLSECPMGVIFQHRDLDHVIICDFCFECTEICNTSAIVRSNHRKAKSAKEA